MGVGHPVIRVWYVCQDELREVVLAESGQEAVFEDVVSSIKWSTSRVNVERELLRTSLISPGGDWRIKALATWMRSSEFAIRERE
jgi:hypothetical protein